MRHPSSSKDVTPTLRRKGVQAEPMSVESFPEESIRSVLPSFKIEQLRSGETGAGELEARELGPRGLRPGELCCSGARGARGISLAFFRGYVLAPLLRRDLDTAASDCDASNLFLFSRWRFLKLLTVGDQVRSVHVSGHCWS